MEKQQLNVIDQYIEEQNPEIIPHLEQVRNAIRKAIPHATEKISWGMPTWWDKHNIIHFAAHKKHLGLYPGADGVEYFSEKLKEKGLKFSKGAIQFPYENDMLLAFIQEIAKWCYEHNR